MNLASSTVLQPLPLPPRFLVPKPAPHYDATTRAVLRHLLADRDTCAVTFSELMAICWTMTRPLFLTAPDGVVTVRGVPQFSDESGGRTVSMSRQEGTAYDETRGWIKEWLLTFLLPYRKLSANHLEAAAERGEFRYLGRLCRQALADEIDSRIRRAKKQNFKGFVHYDAEVGDGESLGDYIGTNRQDAASSLAEHSREESVAAIQGARRIVMANEEELSRLDLFTGWMAYLLNAEIYVDSNIDSHGFEGAVTRTIASLRGVSLRSASAYKRRFVQAVRRELWAGNRVVRAIVAELSFVPSKPFMSQGSNEAASNRGLLNEAREIMAGCASEYRQQGLVQSARGMDAAIRSLGRRQERALAAVLQEQD
jgi:hypothetical protein